MYFIDTNSKSPRILTGDVRGLLNLQLVRRCLAYRALRDSLDVLPREFLVAT